MQKAKNIIVQMVGLALVFLSQGCAAQSSNAHADYLDALKAQLQQTWPNNKTVNLVFHGHSVPAGYFITPEVNTLNAYPHLSLKKIKETYPTAVVNSIVTAIGGEQSEQGAERFKDEVLSHRPNVLFIDYALNDRSIGLKRSKIAWEKMIIDALAYGTKIILLTPTPDVKEDILSDKSPLEAHSQQIRALAKTYKVGLVDSYALFKEVARTENLATYMAQNNHVNEKGHEVVVKAIVEFF